MTKMDRVIIVLICLFGIVILIGSFVVASTIHTENLIKGNVCLEKLGEDICKEEGYHFVQVSPEVFLKDSQIKCSYGDRFSNQIFYADIYEDDFERCGIK